MSEHATHEDDSEQTISEGTVLRKKDTGDEYQLVDDDALGIVATEIGDRTLSDEQAPEVGDDCIRPNCDGTVKDVNGRRWCSEGCLEWLRTTPAQGDECDKYGDKCDGHLDVTVNDNGQVNHKCDTCSREGWSAEITWRESWLPFYDRNVETGSEHSERGDSR